MGTQNDRDSLAVIPGVGVTASEFAKIIEQNTNINLRVGMPCEVLTWSPPVSAGPLSKPAMVSVLPHFKFTVAINTPGELTPDEAALGWVLLEENGGYVKQKALPVISNVPVHYPGSAGMLMRGPLKVKEVGWIKFCDRSIDKWTQTGGPVDPGFAQFHDITDAIFEPGLRFGLAAGMIDLTKWVLGTEDGSAGFEIDAVDSPALPNITMRTLGESATVEALTSVLLGIGAQLGVARLTDTTSADAGMQSFITGVVVAIGQIAALLNAPGPVIGAPGSVTPVTPPGDFGVITSASVKVKAE